MEITGRIAEVRDYVAAARKDGLTVGLVPTMGALHKGHLSLIDRSVASCGFTVVSIFVNPTQFAPTEDFDAYPRNLQADAKLCARAGVDVVFAPDANEMYPQQNLTWVSVEQMTAGLCGKSRPGHFRGVTTVCMKLFNIVGADKAFFGQKDAQQTAVIRRMVEDTNLPLEIVICPTVREPDGLAMSSRNAYLGSDQRKDAVLLHKALQDAQSQLSAGNDNCADLISRMNAILSSSKLVEVDYINIVDAENLTPLDRVDRKAIIAIAANVGKTRLIDNMIVDLNTGGISV